jgi:hypothetical protein
MPIQKMTKKHTVLRKSRNVFVDIVLILGIVIGTKGGS